MEKRTRKIIYFSLNIFRIIVGLFLLLIFLSELHSIFLDPITYERVYTGEFFGEDNFKTLYHLILSNCIYCGVAFIYLIFVILHLTKLKEWKILTWTLRIIDVIIAIVLIIYVIPNIVRELLFQYS